MVSFSAAAGSFCKACGKGGGMERARRRPFLALLAALAFVPSAWSQNATIRLSADLREAPRRIFHARLEMPVKPGPLTLLYPKWIPGEHAPDGPIADLVGLKLTANGKAIPWHRDDLDMFMFHVELPSGETALELTYNHLSTARSKGLSSAPNTP